MEEEAIFHFNRCLKRHPVVSVLLCQTFLELKNCFDCLQFSAGAGRSGDVPASLLEGAGGSGDVPASFLEG